MNSQLLKIAEQFNSDLQSTDKSISQKVQSFLKFSESAKSEERSKFHESLKEKYLPNVQKLYTNYKNEYQSALKEIELNSVKLADNIAYTFMLSYLNPSRFLDNSFVNNELQFLFSAGMNEPAISIISLFDRHSLNMVISDDNRKLYNATKPKKLMELEAKALEAHLNAQDAFRVLEAITNAKLVSGVGMPTAEDPEVIESDIPAEVLEAVEETPVRVRFSK